MANDGRLVAVIEAAERAAGQHNYKGSWCTVELFYDLQGLTGSLSVFFLSDVEFNYGGGR